MYTGIIILNYNNYQDTINCIKSVEQFNTSPVKFIIVDNASTCKDAVPTLISFFKNYDRLNFHVAGNEPYESDKLKKFTLCINPHNTGYAKGNNIGLSLAYKDNEIDNILILNNDIIFVEDIIPKLIRDKETLDRCGVVSPVLYKKGQLEIDKNCARREVKVHELIKENLFFDLSLLFHFQINKHRFIIQNDCFEQVFVKIDLPSGSCMLFDKQLMKDIGSFDERTFLYFEEDILYKKLSTINRINYLDTSCRCIHLGATSISKSSSEFILKVGLNSSKVYVKNYSGCSKLTYLLFLFSVWLRLSLFKFRKSICK